MEKFEFKGHPENADAAYWEAEKEKWLNGSDGLTGRHYFYLTMAHLKTIKGKTIRPVYREVDKFVFNEYQRCLELGKDLLIIHRKEYGISSMFGANESIYNALIHNGCVSLLTSSNQKVLTSMFIEKVRFFFEHLPLIVTIKNKRNNWLNGIKLFGQKFGSIIYALTTRKSDRLISFRAQYIFIDNIFHKKNTLEVLKASQACVKMGFNKIGTIVMAGSCDDADPKIIDLVEEIVMNADELNVRVLFIPGNLGIEEYPLPQEVKKHILDLREIFKDPDALKAFIKRYPLTIEEIFTK